jgi:hypothetical protein
VRVDPQRIVHAPHPHLPPKFAVAVPVAAAASLAREAVQCLPLVAKKATSETGGRLPGGRPPTNRLLLAVREHGKNMEKATTTTHSFRGGLVPSDLGVRTTTRTRRLCVYGTR